GAIRAVSTRAPDQPLPVQAKTVIRVQRDARLLAIDREYLPTATNFRNTRHVPADTGEAVTCPAVIGQRDGWLQAVYAFRNSYGDGIRRCTSRRNITVTGRGARCCQGGREESQINKNTDDNSQIERRAFHAPPFFFPCTL